MVLICMCPCGRVPRGYVSARVCAPCVCVHVGVCPVCMCPCGCVLRVYVSMWACAMWVCVNVGVCHVCREPRSPQC